MKLQPERTFPITPEQVLLMSENNLEVLFAQQEPLGNRRIAEAFLDRQFELIAQKLEEYKDTDRHAKERAEKMRETIGNHGKRHEYTLNRWRFHSSLLERALKSKRSKHLENNFVYNQQRLY